MLAASMLAVALVTASAHTESWDYAYTNRDGSQMVMVGQHFYERLVAEKWCVKVYVKRNGAHEIHICVI